MLYDCPVQILPKAYFFLGRIAAEVKKTVDMGYRYRRYREEAVHEEGGGTQNTRTVQTGVGAGVTVSTMIS